MAGTVTTKMNHGGARQGAGRKPGTDGPVSRRNVTLDNKTISTLKKFGFGDLSQGIRRAAQLIELNKGILMANQNNAAMKKGSSMTLNKRAGQLEKKFDINTPEFSKPSERFDSTVEQLYELLHEVARRSFDSGAKYGANATVDAILNGKLTYEEDKQMLFFQQPDKPITIPSRMISGKSTTTGNDVNFKVGPVKLTPNKLGFED